MLGDGPRSLRAYLSSALGCALFAIAFSGHVAYAEEPQGIVVRLAASFDRAGFTTPDAAGKVLAAGNLKSASCCVSGWADYDFDITHGGWYQIWVKGGALETFVDPNDRVGGEPVAYFFGGSGLDGDTDKIGNVWLSPGRHTVRVQDYRWFGFPDLREIELRRSGEEVDGTVSIPWPRAGQIFRTGGCPTFALLSGGRRERVEVSIKVQDRLSGHLTARQNLQLPASAGLVRQEFTVPCSMEGFFRVFLAQGNGARERDIDWRGVKGFDYDVVDTRPSMAFVPTSARSVLTIDCAHTPPDYQSDDSVVRNTAVGAYRESGPHGFMPFQYASATDRKSVPTPSWFAYALPGVEAGDRYRIDIDYPDDGDRTFGILLREAQQHSYPLAIGVDTGGPYPLSHRLQTIGMTVWARSAVPRLVFAPPHEGKRAACSRISVSLVAPAQPMRASEHVEGRREFVYWYEEGLNFIDLFGAAKEDPQQIARAIDRWTGTVAEEGGTTLMPTVLVYGGQLYPSRFNLMQMMPDQDYLRRILLDAERFRLKVIPELHPRSDELMYGKDESAARRLLLISKDGNDNYYSGDGHTRVFPPHYNLLKPEVQEWFIAMIGELADRYRDSPALQGISLRFMSWSNASLFNLVDLDWGYNDDLVSRFEAETGVALPPMDPKDPGRYSKRYAWLSTIGRNAWVSWRCEQVTALLRRVAQRIQVSRSDLKLYLHAMPSEAEIPYYDGPDIRRLDTPLTRLRMAGLDPAAISHIPGALVIDSVLTYGRDRAQAVEKGLLDPLRDPRLLSSLRGEASGYLPYHRYVEMTEDAIRPEELGFPRSTHATWASFAVNRAGGAAMERFAVELAENDALMLGDGGNAYIYSVPGLRDFLTDYTRLPATSFQTNTAPRSGVVVRSLENSEGWWMYAINRESTQQCMELEVQASGPILELSDNRPLIQEAGRINLRLPAYAILAAHAQVRVKILTTTLKSECAGSSE